MFLAYGMKNNLNALKVCKANQHYSKRNLIAFIPFCHADLHIILYDYTKSGSSLLLDYKTKCIQTCLCMFMRHIIRFLVYDSCKIASNLSITPIMILILFIYIIFDIEKQISELSYFSKDFFIKTCCKSVTKGLQRRVI